MLLKRALNLGAALLVVLVCAFTVRTVAAVTMDDLASHLKIQLGDAQLGGGVHAGDVFAIDRSRMTQVKLCSVPVDSTAVNHKKVRTTFTNSLGSSIPYFGRIFGVEGTEIDSGSQDLAGFKVRMRFEATETRLKGTDFGDPDPSCEARMATRAAAGDLICIVNYSLIPEDNEIFTAFSFNPIQMFVTPAVFTANGLGLPDGYFGFIGNTFCPKSSPVSWDVALRKSLRVLSVNFVSEEIEPSS